MERTRREVETPTSSMMTRTSLSLGQVSVFIVGVQSADNVAVITIYWPILGQVCQTVVTGWDLLQSRRPLHQSIILEKWKTFNLRKLK